MAPPDPLVPEFAIKVDGSPLAAEVVTSIRSVEIREQLNMPAACYVKLAPSDAEASASLGFDTFAPGARIDVSLGVDGVRAIFSGKVFVLEPTFGDETSLLVTAYDALHLLRFGTKCRSFNDVTLSDVATQMAQGGGLSVDTIDSTATRYETLLQDNVSDFDFLSSYLTQLDYELAIRGGGFCFGRSAQGQGAKLELAYPEDVSDLWLRLKVLTRGSSTQVRAWDRKTQRSLVGQASGSADAMGGEQNGFALSESVHSSAVVEGDWNILDETGASAAATALRNTQLASFLEGEAEVTGNPAVRAGINLKLLGLGTRYSGLYYVTSTHHHYDIPGGYMTRFGVRRTGV